VLGVAWTAAADATNDGAAAAHNTATVPTVRAAAATLALKVLVMGGPYSLRRSGVFGVFRKGSGIALQDIVGADAAKMLHRHADLRKLYRATDWRS
jgi:hypothetical protein